MFRQRLLTAVLVLASFPLSVLAQSPVLLTQTPAIGNSGSVFFVFLPVANAGSAPASNMQLTSVVLSFLGSPAAPTSTPSSVPFTTGSGYLAPTGVRTLDLEFENSKLVHGNKYLVTVKGSYDFKGKTYGFELNRFVTYAAGLTANHPQVLDLISSKFDSLPGVDRLADNQAMLAFVKGLPQISSAGLTDPPTSVWATFADNREKIVILNNLPLPSPPAPSLVSSSAASPSPKSPLSELTSNLFSPSPVQAGSVSPRELPASIKVRILNGLGAGFDNAASDIDSWLVGLQAYADAIGADMSVESLRNVGGDAVLYIGSHGGADKNANVPFNIWTSTLITKDPKDLNPSDPVEGPLQDDIAKGRLIDVTACDHYSFLLKNCVSEHHYAFTADFVVAHWNNFSPNAFVYIDTCDSFSSEQSAVDFRDAIFSKLASVYAGWTGEVDSQHASDSARLVFDRLLGANSFCPEDGRRCHSGPAEPPAFAQRAFDHTQVAVDLPLHHLGNDGTAALTFLKNPYIESGFGLLAPSISNMLVDELSHHPPQLTLYGVFGSDPRPSGSVQVGGQDVNIQSWKPTEIVVDLANSGPGAVGDVQVKVRLHKSNVARLTEWKGNQFNATIAGNGSQRITQNFNLHFRADIRKFRKQIHLPPDEPFGGISGITDSTASYAASGSGPGIGELFLWSGSGNMVYGKPGIPITGITIFDFAGQVLDSTHMITALGSASEANAGATCTIRIPKAPDQISFLDISGPSNIAQLVAQLHGILRFTFELDSNNANILAGSSSKTGLFYFCEDSNASATYSFKWGPVPATQDTVPDPKSAR